MVTAIRDTCADWINNREDANDPALKGEKDPKTGHKVRIKNRACGLSSTQVRKALSWGVVGGCIDDVDKFFMIIVVFTFYYIISPQNISCYSCRYQLYMVRTMVESLISNKAANKKTMKKEMDTAHYTELDRFYNRY